MEVEINIWHIVASMIASFAIGMLWYGPLFGKLWMSLTGITKEHADEMKKKGMASTFILSALTAAVTAWVLAWLGASLEMTGFVGALQLAFWPWLGFVVTYRLNPVLWQGESWKLYGLDIAHQFVILFAMALIITLWV